MLLHRTIASAALALAALPCTFCALAAGDLQMPVSARIAKHVRVQVLSQPQTVEVTAADVARGFVEAPQRVQMAVQSNTQDGYSLAFTKHAGFVRQARVSGLGAGEMQLQGDMLATTRPAAGRGVYREVLEMAFRFELSPEARQGTYPWPIQVAVLPL